MCGSEPCYQMSRRKKEICRPVFDRDGRSIFDHLSSELPFTHFIVVLLGILMLASAVASYGIRNQSGESVCRSERNNLVGDLFSSALFLIIICLLNLHTFNPHAFCLMNPTERFCDSYREGLTCASAYPLNVKTELGTYFDGYSGFFKRINVGNPVKCFLDLGQNSLFQFMWFNFGTNTKWTESSFVLLDGELAPFQPKMDFFSIPRINCAWLEDLRESFSSHGIFIFNVASEIDLYYHYPEIPKGVKHMISS